MQGIPSLNPPVVTGICDPNKSRARHHRSLKLASKSKHLNIKRIVCNKAYCATVSIEIAYFYPVILKRFGILTTSIIRSLESKRIWQRFWFFPNIFRVHVIFLTSPRLPWISFDSYPVYFYTDNSFHCSIRSPAIRNSFHTVAEEQQFQQEDQLIK